MISRDRLTAWARGTGLVLVYAGALTVAPLLIATLSQWVTIPHVDWFHYTPNDDAPPFAQQFHDWLINTYDTIRIDLDDRARAGLVIIVVLGGSWLGLVWITLSTLWCLARNGGDALRDRVASRGPRGWIASLLTTLVLSGAASPAYAATATTRAAATAPQHPHDDQPHGHGSTAEHPRTPGDHTHPPPRQPDVHLPADIRPDCSRYRVHRTDTLSTIAERELGSIARWPDLARVNAFQLGRNPDHLEPGWEILLPPEAAPPKQNPTKVVTVARGDTLWSISERELGTPNRWGELWDLNLRRTQPDGLQLSLPDRLQPDWHIVVPDEPHNKPPTGFTPTAPVPSRDPFTIDPWPDPFPPAHESPSPAPSPEPAPRPGAASPPEGRGTQHTPPRDTSLQHGAPSPAHEHGFRPADGIEPAPGVFLGLGLAAAVNVALARARLRHRSTHVPGRPCVDDHPAPTVYALRIAHLNATHDPDTHEPHTTEHTHPTDADRIAIRPTPRSTPTPQAPAHTPLPVELGVQNEQTLRLDLATCHGLGLSGPLHTDAVRALLLQLLSRHTPREETPIPVVMTRADAELLLSDVDDPPSTVHLVEDLPEALEVLETASTTGPTPQHPSTQDTAGATHTVLVTRSPIEHAHRLHTLLRDRRGIAALLHGPWPDGVTLTLDHHGVITHATPEASPHLRGARLFTATPQAGNDLLPLTPTPRTPLPPKPPPVNLFTLTYGYDPRATNSTAQNDSCAQPGTNSPAGTPAARSQPVQAEPERTRTSLSVEEAAGTVPGEVIDTQAANSSVPAADRDAAPTSAADSLAGTPTRDPDAPPLRLHVFGGFRLIWTDPTGTEHALTCTRGQRVLLTYLGVNPHGIARETLLQQLWGGVAQPTNTANTQLSRLRQNLHQATRGELSDIIDATHHRFRLDPAVVSSDYADFEHAAAHLRHAENADERQQALHTLLRCHTGILGAGLDEYEWLHIPRYEADRVYINAIGELARTHVEHDPDHTLHLLESALRDDPYNEALYRDIMRLQHQLDLDHTISHTYTLLKTRLGELDADPEPHTTALADQLLQHTPPTTS